MEVAMYIGGDSEGVEIGEPMGLSTCPLYENSFQASHQHITLTTLNVRRSLLNKRHHVSPIPELDHMTKQSNSRCIFDISDSHFPMQSPKSLVSIVLPYLTHAYRLLNQDS